MVSDKPENFISVDAVDNRPTAVHTEFAIPVIGCACIPHRTQNGSSSETMQELPELLATDFS